MPQDNATLRVLVTTALGALPISGASVTISTVGENETDRTLLYTVETDSSGYTPPLSLDTPPVANSLSPNMENPYATYTVQVQHPSFTPLASLNITMFPGIPSVVPIALTPLPENANNASQQVSAWESPQTLS